MSKIIFSTLARSLFSIFVSVLIVIPVWTFIARPFIINGSSMYPTFNLDSSRFGDYLFVELVSYKFKDPERGDVIVFKGDRSKGAEKSLIKRIIALPNETVSLNRNNVTITKEDGTKMILDEPYINGTESITYKPLQKTLGIEEYFVMGDNRNNSFDSRFLGEIKREEILGQAMLRLYPFKQIKVYPGKERYE